jgi:DNA polymerase I-like protein with 3'-5' exonuclease and polymerase domains
VTEGLSSLPFAKIIACDFEFLEPPGERPTPVCMVARELRTGREIRMWQDEFTSESPFPTDESALFVAYAASAELKCMRVLGWPMPQRILDPYVEFRARTSGMGPEQGRGLLDALTFYGLPHITSEQKTRGRALVLKGPPWSESERREILDYCATDVEPLGPLLERMLPGIRATRLGLGQSLLRGRYMGAVASMELQGVPVDTETLAAIRDHREAIKADLVREVDAAYGVYEGTTFKLDRFEVMLHRHQISNWPRTETGRPSLEEKVFRAGCDTYPFLHPLRELRDFLDKMKLESLAVGVDGRNRVAIMPFKTKTGRNAPSNAAFIYGPGKWIRHLIRPEEGSALIYVDWSLQEWAISAALSGDEAMLEVLSSEDTDMYLTFAEMAGWCPPGAKKATHREARDRAKPCVLAVGYGMQAEGLALRMGTSTHHATQTLQAYARRFPRYWAWAESQVEQGDLRRRMRSCFGWPLRIYDGDRANTLRNFPCQSNAAEMMRLAASLMCERGLAVCAPVHDAFLLEAPIDDVDYVKHAAQSAMAEASRVVLDGYEVKTDDEVTEWPDRCTDGRGSALWEKICDQLSRRNPQMALAGPVRPV